MNTTTSRLLLGSPSSARAAHACGPIIKIPAADSTAAARRKSRLPISLVAATPAFPVTPFELAIFNSPANSHLRPHRTLRDIFADSHSHTQSLDAQPTRSVS